MSATCTLPRRPDPVIAAADDHIFCWCTPTVSLCGTDIDMQVDVRARWDGASEVCPLCAVADEQACPRCGR